MGTIKKFSLEHVKPRELAIEIYCVLTENIFRKEFIRHCEILLGRERTYWLCKKILEHERSSEPLIKYASLYVIRYNLFS